jgi:GTPase SAR1 family protein
MRRIVTIPLILVVGGLVLWEVVSWGTRTWAKYKLLKEPLPSITTFLPTSMIQPLIMLVMISVLAFATVSAILRSRKIFGLIPLSELVRHMVVLGPTGSGKTTVAKTVLEKAVKEGKPAVIIDWKGEYAQFISGATIIRKIDNVWNVPGESAREKALVAVELIREMSRDTVEITPPSSLLLLRVLTEEYERGVPTTEKIVKVLERHAEIAQREGRYAESNMYLALIRRLFILLVDEERKAENAYVESQITIYDLGSIPSIHLKTLYSNYVLMSIYRESTRSKADGLRTIVVAEEAQNYVPSRRAGELPTIAERIVYELRSYGVGVILVCPDPELLPAPVLKDVGAIVATSPDSLPRFALERYLFRASLEEAEKTLKELKKAKLIIYYRGNLHYLRRLPKPPKTLKPKERPKGDRMGANEPGVGLLRAWPILPRRSPGRPKVVEVEEEVEEMPKVIEVKAVEVEEPLKLEEEELEEAEVTEVEETSEPKAIDVKVPHEQAIESVEEKMVEESVSEEAKMAEEEEAKMIEEEMPMTVEPQPAPKGPPIPSTLPYWVQGRPA